MKWWLGDGCHGAVGPPGGGSSFCAGAENRVSWNARCRTDSVPALPGGILACSARGGDMDKIVVRGARTHNLKDIDLELTRNRLVGITGLSGSGQSSLAFDPLFAAGRRRDADSLAPSDRQGP